MPMCVHKKNKFLICNLKFKFEMKDRGKIRFCLDLELEHQDSGIWIHQSAYIQKMLRRFNVDKVHSVSTPWGHDWLDPISKEGFISSQGWWWRITRGWSVISKCNMRIVLFSSINALEPISLFVVNLLDRFNFAPMQRHWIDIKIIFRYLKGTIDMSLFYPIQRDKRSWKKEV
jgi:hypothetical protein